MSFWLISGLIALASAGALGLALRRARGLTGAGRDAIETELGVYRDQLAEVERDLARGVLGAQDAARARLEVSRRMLEADRGARRIAPVARTGVAGALVLVVLVTGSAGWLYTRLGAPGYADLPLERRLALAEETRRTRPGQAAAEADMPPVPTIEADPQHVQLVERLRAALDERPADLTGLELLARNEMALGLFARAHEAQARLIALKGEAASADDHADHAEMMILAAGGYVSPEAEAALTRALTRDPQHPAAIYYSGLMFAQTGRPDMTFRLWRPLLERSAADDAWVAPIRGQIEQVARAAGLRYTLPPETALSGPGQDDIEAAADLDPEARQQMIRGMVDGLMARLANSGGTPEEWARLITSLGVLGEDARARAIWQEAQVTFGADPAALATLRAAAESSGIAP